MKKIFMLFVAVLFIGSTISAQKVKTKTTSTGAVSFMPIQYKNDDGTTSSYFLEKGDKLVYHVNAGGSEYDFIVTLNAAGFGGGIDFNYAMTNASKTKGHVNISGDARKSATKYINYFRGGDLNLTDASSVWLSTDNYIELPTQSTDMTFDDGEEESFYRSENLGEAPMIKIKGKARKLDVYLANNSSNDDGDKTLWINDAPGNPLIIKMSLGFTIELKEIR
jgi:hypothetical protein